MSNVTFEITNTNANKLHGCVVTNNIINYVKGAVIYYRQI